MLNLVAALLLSLPGQAAPRPEIAPDLKSVIDRFFETQQTEDAAGYLALWSASATRPQPQQLQFIFDSGDDTFIDIEIVRAAITGDSARVRVAATRVRADARLKNPDGTPRLFSTRLQLALALRREEGAWKIIREGAPADELAAALIEATDASARKTILDSEPGLVNVRLFEALGRRADSLAQIENYKGAQAIYEGSLEIAQAIGDRKSEGQALQNIANSLYFQRDFSRALIHYERRLAIEREAGNEDGVASALSGAATVRYATYEYGAALTLYREALAIQERLDDNLLVSMTLISTGNVLYLQGDYEAAIADYRRAEALKRKYFDLGGAATALEGLGRVYSAQGDFAAALSAFSGVLDERRKRNDLARMALVLQSIGEIHFQLANTDQARLSFAESRKQFDAIKDTGNAGRVLQGTALNELVVGRFAAGEKAYAESIQLCTVASDQECIARAQVGLAFALAAQQKYDDAIVWYGRSLVSFNALSMEDPAARARLGLAEALYGKGDFAKALEQAVIVRRTAVVLTSDDLLWRALVSEARVERKLERQDAALGAARAALLAVQRMTTAALDRPGQAAPRDTTSAYATAAVLQAEAGDAAAAFVTAEQMRAHALRVALAANERDIARGMTDEERAVERTLSSELTTLIVMRDRQKALPNPDSAQIEKLTAAIAEATARRNAARQALFARLPELQTWRGLGPASSPADLETLLDGPGKIVLQFVVDDHDVVVLAASRPEPSAPPTLFAQAVPIERQALAERIARALDGQALASVEGWRKESAELFQVLPAVLRDRLATAKSIVIIPDDVLWRVPFEAMPVETGFLADRGAVVYAASIAAAVQEPVTPPGGPSVPLLAIHSPELPPTMVATLQATAPTWVLRSPDAAAAEVGRLAKLAPPPVILTGSGATKQALQQATAPGSPSSGAPMFALHVAAPFRVNSAGPLFSPMLLAAEPKVGEGPPREPELEVRELFNLPPMASVVLFSDPAALSKRDAAAAVIPVHWAWRAAGATALIVRRWGGDELAASEIVAGFYAGLRAGKTPSAALDAARASVRSTESGRAPTSWAGWLILTR